MSRDGSRTLNGRCERDGTAVAPIIILTSLYSGADSVRSILASSPGLTCTSGTGILPLCAQAEATWRHLEQRTAGLSALGASSVRALASTMITCMMAGSGGHRWCEVATTPVMADPFARLFPQARFICLYRACPEVISAATRASRWGLGSAGLGEFAAIYPGNSVAATAAYWCANTRALLDFEAAHPGRSLRVLHEDLSASRAMATTSILRFAGVDNFQPGWPDPPVHDQDTVVSSPSTGAEQIPVELLPVPMLNRINDLHAVLGYPVVSGLQEPDRR